MLIPCVVFHLQIRQEFLANREEGARNFAELKHLVVSSHSQNSRVSNPLFEAINERDRRHRDEEIRVLISRTRPGEDTPLHKVDNMEEDLEQLVQRANPLDFEKRDAHGNTPLECLLRFPVDLRNREKFKKRVELLLEKTNLFSADDQGNTLLHKIASSGPNLSGAPLQIFLILLQKKAFPLPDLLTAKNKKRETPISLLRASNNPSASTLLSKLEREGLLEEAQESSGGGDGASSSAS